MIRQLEPMCCVRYAVPLHAINHIVGLNGETIQRIALECQVHAVLSPVFTAGLDERVFSVSGRSHESVQVSSQCDRPLGVHKIQNSACVILYDPLVIYEIRIQRSWHFASWRRM
jgi:hypothetical protein